MSLRVPAAAAAALTLAVGGARAAPADAPRAPAPTDPAIPIPAAAHVACRASDAAERAALEAEARTLFGHIAARRYRAMFERFAAEARREADYAPFEGLMKLFENAVAAMDENARLNSPEIVAVHALHVAARPASGLAECRGADGQVVAEVAVGDAPRQAHVLIEGEAAGMRWAFNFWFRLKDGDWSLYGFGLNNTTMGGRDAAALWAAAREERARGETFNAAVLYRAAVNVATRGSYYRLPIRADIEADLRSMDPRLSAGAPLPVWWTEGGTTWGAEDTFIAQNDDGTVRVGFRRRASTWPSAEAVEAENRRMIESYLRTHPGFARAFPVIQVVALHPDGRTTQITTFVIDQAFAGEGRRT